MITNYEMLNIINGYTDNWNDYDFSELIWNSSTAEGKATVAEIIGHLLNWDKHLITNVIPSMTRGEGMLFPEFDSFNKLGYEYARSLPKSVLINEFINTRKELSRLLLNSIEVIDRPTTSNGVRNCPHTGKPYTLLYIIQEFIEHDEHHKKQINSVRSKIQQRESEE